jgi:hypothetical protein
MAFIQKIISVLALIFFADAGFYAQTAPVKKDITFSAVSGTISKPNSIKLPSTAQSVSVITGDTSFFKILSVVSKNCIVVFKPAVNFTGIAKTKLLATNSVGQLVTEISLTGLSTKGLEGENEPPLSKIIETLDGLVWLTIVFHNYREKNCPILFLLKQEKEKLK